MLSLVWMTGWLPPPPPPWDAYRKLMACRIVELDKIPGVIPVRIEEMLRRAHAKIVMRAVGN